MIKPSFPRFRAKINKLRVRNAVPMKIDNILPNRSASRPEINRTNSEAMMYTLMYTPLLLKPRASV